jgi:hypothetical protein
MLCGLMSDGFHLQLLSESGMERSDFFTNVTLWFNVIVIKIALSKSYC